MGFLSSAFKIGAELVGASIASKANKKATRQSRAADAAAQAEIAAANRQAAARAVQASQQPVTLGPTDQRTLQQARNTTQTQLRASGLSGSGRASTAAVRRVEGDIGGSLIEKERTRQERLATNLGNLDISTAQSGAATSRRAGAGAARQTTANAGLRSSAIGSVLGTIADEAKQRQSRREP